MEKKKKLKVSGWSKEADYRIKNRKWLRYSGEIAMQIHAQMEDRPEINQAWLAKAIGVTPQYVSKLLKGHQNLSLETIAKLSEALGVELISFPEFKYSRPFADSTYEQTIDSEQVGVFDIRAEAAEIAEFLSQTGNGDGTAQIKRPKNKNTAGTSVHVTF